MSSLGYACVAEVCHKTQYSMMLAGSGFRFVAIHEDGCCW